MKFDVLLRESSVESKAPTPANSSEGKMYRQDARSHMNQVGGDQIVYPGDKSTGTAGLTTAKILFNHTLSTPGARFLVIDIKNVYLNTPLGR
jgi:hypothetical protein